MSQAVTPERLELASTQVDRLFGSFRKAEADDPETFTAGCVRLFAAYPPEAAEFVLDPVTGLPGRSEWLPSLKAVREALETWAAGRQRAAQAAARAAAEAQQVAARVDWLKDKHARPTLEDLRARYGENWGLTVTRHDDEEARARRRELLDRANRRAFAAECERAGMPADRAVSPGLLGLIRGKG